MAGLPHACLLLLTAACATDPGEEAALLMRQALATTQASLAATGLPQGAAPAAAAAPARGAAPVPAAAVPDPAGPRRRGNAPPAAATTLVGIRAEQLRGMLGDPSIRRPEGAAEIWLYEAPSCRLDVILYAEGNALVVAHAAARALGAGEAVTEAACLSAIAAAPAPAPWPGPGRRA